MAGVGGAGLGRAPLCVCLPFVWPETFSFVTYEALGVLRVPVVVGPWGHPARLVREQGVGAVMRAATPEALVEAVLDVERRHEALSARVEESAGPLLAGRTREAYLARLEQLCGPLAPRGGEAGWSGPDPLGPVAAPPEHVPSGADRLAAACERLVRRVPGGTRAWGWAVRAANAPRKI